ncbi:hypothetical protein SK128_026975, partial [Halocaridina rubra]
MRLPNLRFPSLGSRYYRHAGNKRVVSSYCLGYSSPHVAGIILVVSRDTQRIIQDVHKVW